MGNVIQGIHELQNLAGDQLWADADCGAVAVVLQSKCAKNQVACHFIKAGRIPVLHET